MHSPTPASTSQQPAEAAVLLVLLPPVGTAQPVRAATLTALKALQAQLGPAIRVLTVDEGTNPVVVHSFPPLDLPAFVLVRQGVELWRQQGLPEGEFIVAQLLDKLAVPPARAGAGSC
ncbi:thioredoxin [Hymenobacter sp. BRD128]|uniref:thioredoxin n=1 Tax=Hymenobacter sp. BRD128 TaxID=2675878 RepID=UPI0015994899|nr:thioredoxin [Hymenobacter sp. BRD128]QKG55250.1 thioredoxin [Hymenobacter sp. BRD128]